MNKLRVRLAAAAWLIIATTAVHARPDHDWTPHVAVGAATSIAGEYAWVASVGVERRLPHTLFGGDLSFDVTLLTISGRDDTGRRLDDDVQAVAFGLRWRRNGWLLGFAPAAATARTDAISGMAQFLSTAGYQWKRFGLYLQHLSNASTNGDNIGETTVMAEYRFGGDN